MIVAPPAAWPAQSFLGYLSPDARNALLALGTHREHPVAGPLAVAGDPCTDVLVLVDGHAKVIGSAADGRQALLALHLRGDLVGAQDALDDRPRSVSVVSTGPAVVRTIGKPLFVRYLLDWPEAGVAISRALCVRLRWATSRQLDLSGLPVLARLASVLSDLAELDLGSTHALTQPELAAMIGASEPSVHKAMRQLRADGVIETGYRKIVIRDLAALDAVANAAFVARPIRARTEVRPARGTSREDPCSGPATSGLAAFQGTRSLLLPHRPSARSRRSPENPAGVLPSGDLRRASAGLAT